MDKKELINLAIKLLGGLLVVCLIIIVVYWIVNRTKNVTTNIKLAAEANAEIDTSKLTMTTTQVNNVVSKLKTAFYSGLFGATEDEDAIYKAYEMLGSRSDVLAVEKEFGVYKDKTLKEHIYKLLDEDEIAHINEILSAKNINYQY